MGKILEFKRPPSPPEPPDEDEVTALRESIADNLRLLGLERPDIAEAVCAEYIRSRDRLVAAYSYQLPDLHFPVENQREADLLRNACDEVHRSMSEPLRQFRLEARRGLIVLTTMCTGHTARMLMFP